MVTEDDQNQDIDHFGELTALAAGDRKSCRYGFFPKIGGVSGAPYSSLNVGLHVGDSPPEVHRNRELVKQKMGAQHLLSALQVHGAGVYVQRAPLKSDLEVDGYDALVTNVSGIALMVQHADCQPVLLYDPHKNAIAAVHSGWRGSVQNILATVVEKLREEYSSDPQNISAITGPSLGPCCAEFINYKKELPVEFQKFKQGENHFDFWQITRKQLLDAGLVERNITTLGKCTCCSSYYFSYRRAVRSGNGVTGRNGSVIMLDEGR